MYALYCGISSKEMKGGKEHGISIILTDYSSSAIIVPFIYLFMNGINGISVHHHDMGTRGNRWSDCGLGVEKISLLVTGDFLPYRAYLVAREASLLRHKRD